MNPMMANTSQKRNRSIGCWPGRRARFTEPIRFRKAMKPKRAIRAPPVAMIAGLRSDFSWSRTRAFSSSAFVISALLLHVPDDEDETELTQGNHEAHDDVQEHEDRAG